MPERAAQGGMRALGGDRDLARDVAERLVVMDLEVRGLDRSPDLRRIARVGARGQGREHGGDDGERTHRVDCILRAWSDE